MVHTVGESVYAKWPWSNLWYPAIVQRDFGGSCFEVVFEDGTDAEVNVKYIKSTAQFEKVKTPTRRRSRSRGRSRSPARTTKATKQSTSSPKRAGRPRSSSRTRKTEVDTPRPTSRTRRAAPTPKTPSTPSRQSARIAMKVIESDVIKSEVTSRGDSSSSKTAATTSLPFGGPFGALFLIFFLPAVMFLVNMACKKDQCTIMKLPTFSLNVKDYIDLNSLLVVVGWIVFQALLAVIPIGSLVKGQALKGGRSLAYRCNGFFALVATMVCFCVAVYMKSPIVTYIPKNFLKLMTSSAIVSLLLAILLAVKSRYCKPGQLSPAATGNYIYDFFMGRELNPRIGSFDLKFFCELRPGLIGWVIIDMSFVASNYYNGNVNYGLILVTAFHLLYVGDGLWFESSILSTMDIVHEGFGYMLSFGDLSWVPFLYCLTARFLYENPHTMPWYCLGAIAVLNVVGYIIFRGSNSQKDAFRRNPYDPALAHLESMPTSAGKRLLISGWWGMCRHPNYLGDLIMSLAWSLPCGFTHVLPYFYPIYFLLLLVDRERRDSGMCQRKYGAAWTRYTDRVKYRIIPYVY